MIYADTKRRVLKPDAIPSINLVTETENNQIVTGNNVIPEIETNLETETNVNDINIDINTNDITSYCATTSNISNIAMENIQCIPNSIPILNKDEQEKTTQLRRTIRGLKKSLSKKKKIIKKRTRKKKILRRGNKWNNITKDLTKSQKIFFDIIEKNLKRAPEVYLFYIFFL